MKEKVLNIFKRNGNKKLDPIEIVKYLSKDYDVKDIKEVMDVICELVSDGSIVSCKKGMFKLTGDEYVKGKVERVSSGNGYLLQSDGDIYIDKKNMNTALTGDLCLCEIFKRFGSTEAKVKKVLDRNLPLGEIVEDSGIVYVKPLKEYPYELELLYNKEFSLVDGEIVKLKCVEENNKVLKVKVIKKIGHKNSPDIDTLKIMAELDVPAGFSEGTMNEVKTLPTEVLESDYKGRTDISNEMIFTIDGKDTKDIDDAVGLKMLDNGNYLLNVSIADVTNYVKWNSSIFNDAYNKGNSTYMADKVEPMLPIELSNGICSLNAGEDRYTLSCSMEITPKAKIVSSDIYKGVICVTERMCYTDVQKILDRSDETVLKRYEKYISYFDLMAELANILKAKRKENGYLNLEIPESKIILDENGVAIDVKKYETYFANEIIEQFMLIANETVAEKFYWLQAPFIYRNHEAPDVDKVKELNKSLYNFGYKIKISKEEIIYPNEFAKILEDVKGKDEEKVVSNIILRTLRVAKYEAENKGHFGIASKYYCHFTSPIRRYPDLFIHRIISKYLDNDYLVNDFWIKKYEKRAEKRAENCSERERVATKVEREAEDIKKAEFMESKIGEEYEGIVSSVTNFGIFVELDNTVEGLIRYEKLGDEYFIYNEEKRQAIGEHTGKVYQIGDKVKIRVANASKLMRQIDFEICEEKAE